VRTTARTKFRFTTYTYIHGLLSAHGGRNRRFKVSRQRSIRTITTTSPKIRPSAVEKKPTGESTRQDSVFEWNSVLPTQLSSTNAFYLPRKSPRSASSQRNWFRVVLGLNREDSPVVPVYARWGQSVATPLTRPGTNTIRKHVPPNGVSSWLVPQ